MTVVQTTKRTTTEIVIWRMRNTHSRVVKAEVGFKLLANYLLLPRYTNRKEIGEKITGVL